MNKADFAVKIALPVITLVVGTFIGPWITRSSDRAKLRASARSALGDVEVARWPDDERTHVAFKRAVQAFQAGAMLARVPRGLVDEYVYLACTARAVCEETMTKDFYAFELREDVREPVISRPHSELVRASAAAVAEYLEHPVRFRFKYRAGIRRRVQVANDVKALDAIHASVFDRAKYWV